MNLRPLRWIIVLLAFSLASCEWETFEQEVGYKGAARVDPWLAAERFTVRSGHTVRAEKRWKSPAADEAVWFVPSVVIRTRSYARQLENWAANGGHVVLLVDRASAAYDDWAEHDEPLRELETPVADWLAGHTVKLAAKRETKPVGEVALGKQTYRNTRSFLRLVDMGNGKMVPVGTKRIVRGRLTVVGDASLFRNRWISDGDHAAILGAILKMSPRRGAVVFLRGDAASLWEMVKKHLWAPLLALGLALAVWLWRSFARFGPIDHAPEAEVLRGYEHHLAALGNFQWKLDRAESLMKPLRAKAVELGQRHAAAIGRRDENLFDVLAERAAIPAESVRRALTMNAPIDGADLTAITATLQKLLQVLQTSPRP